jgi:hypothetical protein
MKLKLKRSFLIVGLLIAFQCLFAGMTSAATYNSSYDKNINLNLPLPSLTSLDTGSLTFNLQQSLYKNVINPTGLSFEYYYYWVSVNDEPLLALDPFKVGF